MMIVRDQLVQVFLNLILNAMDATQEGGTIEIRTVRETHWLRIDVRDDGHGVSDELRNQIFRPYITTKATGTGLGLFVSRNIVEQNGGRIELTDTSPKGTTFTVYLECGDEDVEANDAELSAIEQRPSPESVPVESRPTTI